MDGAKQLLSPDSMAALCSAGVMRPDQVVRELIDQGYRIPKVNYDDSASGSETFRLTLNVTAETRADEVAVAAATAFAAWREGRYGKPE